MPNFYTHSPAAGPLEVSLVLPPVTHLISPEKPLWLTFPAFILPSILAFPIPALGPCILLLLNEFHDVVTGSCIQLVAEAAKCYYKG